MRMALFAAAVLSACGMCQPATHAATIVNETFDSPGATLGDDANDPLDVPWTLIDLGGNFLSIDPDTVIGTGDALRRSGSGFGGATGAFTPTGIGQPGSLMSLSLDFRLGGGPDNEPDALRFGLFDSSGAGYFARLASTNNGSTTGFTLLRDNGTGSPIGAGGDLVTLASDSGPAVTSTTVAHHVDLQLARTPNGVAITADFDNGTSVLNFEDTSGFLTNFDTIGVMANLRDPLVDNLLVTQFQVPEPGTGLLLATACMGLIRYRRRRTTNR